MQPADAIRTRASVAAFLPGLSKLGWIDGRNVRIEYRWAAIDIDRLQTISGRIGRARAGRYPADWRRQSRRCSRPHADDSDRVRDRSDPVGAGFVDSLHGRAATPPGLTVFEYGFSGKWLELLKRNRARLTRVGVLVIPHMVPDLHLGDVQAVAPSLGLELSPVAVREPAISSAPLRRSLRARMTV